MCLRLSEWNPPVESDREGRKNGARLATTLFEQLLFAVAQAALRGLCRL